MKLPIVGNSYRVLYLSGQIYVGEIIINYSSDKWTVGTVLSTGSELSLETAYWSFEAPESLQKKWIMEEIKNQLFTRGKKFSQDEIAEFIYENYDARAKEND
jgi:hypothetical protein